MVTSKKVFLVEDELDIMFVYKTALKAADIDVDGATTGKEAMEKIKLIQDGNAIKPDLILLDLVLPDANGLDILYALRENEVTKNIAVFILTNYNSEALHKTSYIKPDRYILKADTTPTKLAEIVKEQLK